MEHNSRKNVPPHCHAGRPSSFWLQKPERVFGALGLKEGDTFLDLGCGLGEYALYASKVVGLSGAVFALDKAENLIAELRQRATTEDLYNIVPMVADATKPFPLDENSFDVCLVATVLHIPGVLKEERALCAEIGRILKPDGRLAVIECHEKNEGFGPSQEMRLSPEKIRSLMAKNGFKALSELDLGYNFLIQFVRK